MLNLLFIGRFYPKEILKTICTDTNGKVGFSNHNFEMSLINGFAAQKDINIRVVTAPHVFSYPHNNRRIRIKSEKYKEDNINFRGVGFNNIVGYNFISTTRNLTKAIIEELEKFDETEVSIVVNTPSLVLSTALFNAINRSEKKIITTLIVPDVPECMLEMNGRQSLKGKILQRINKKTADLARKYDKYVYLTDAMNDFYHADINDYIVMEGLINDDAVTTYKEPTTTIKDKEIILYSGSLRKIFGVMDLVEVFVKGHFPNTELWICGSGECADQIKKCSKCNPNIKFFGLVDSIEARRLQSQATILANPRPAKGSYTKYSFPSKTIEYLLAGKTVIMNRLPGVPNEYDQYVYYPNNESTEAWITKINEIINMPKDSRQRRDSAGQFYIISNKTAKKQTRRVLNFISKGKNL